MHSWANSLPSCPLPFYLKNGDGSQWIVFIPDWIWGSPEGIIEQYQNPDYSPDELKQSLYGLGVGAGIFFKRSPGRVLLMLRIMAIMLIRLLVASSCLWLQPGWKTAHGPEGRPALLSSTSSAPSWCSPVCWLGSHILGQVQWYFLRAGRKDNVHWAPALWQTHPMSRLSVIRPISRLLCQAWRVNAGEKGSSGPHRTYVLVCRRERL